MGAFFRSRSEIAYRSVLLLALFVVMATSAILVGDAALNENNGVLLTLYGAVFSLAFSTQVSEVYFTKPNDIVVNSITCLVVMIPTRTLLADSPFFWVIVTLAATALLMALISNILFEPSKGTQHKGLSFVALKLAQTFGNGRMLFGMCVFLLMLKVQHHPWPFGATLATALALLLITPTAFRTFVERLRRPAPAEGVVVQTLGNDRVRAEMNSSPQSRSLLAVKLSGVLRYGFPGRTVQGPESSDVDICLIRPDEVPGDIVRTFEGMADGEVRSAGQLSEDSPILGVVTEGTSIHTIAYRPVGASEQNLGDIVQANVGSRQVYYQIQNAEIGIEPTSGPDKGEFVEVHAAQLGVWDADRQLFDREGWIPEPNSLVSKPIAFPRSELRDGEVVLGKIPATEFQVTMNVEEAITHHMAVLGVTGVGKSVFVREFIRSIPVEKAKFICVDITGEYLARLDGSVDLVDSAVRTRISAEIETLYFEKAKFANQQSVAVIKKCEQTIAADFKKAIEAFLDGPDQIAVLQLGDVDGTMQNYEYLRWFFRSVFAVAKSRVDAGGPILSLVLEEAHTIVPEWNFLGDSDRGASSVVNSISQVALQGRKYRVGLLVIAQRTANVSKTVLTQCNTVICFQQFDRTSFEFLNSFMGGSAEDILPNLKLRTAVAAGKALRSTAPLVFRVPDSITEQAKVVAATHAAVPAAAAVRIT